MFGVNMKRLLDSNRGITSIYHEQDGQMIVEKVQDVTDIIESNKQKRNSVSGRMGDLVHVAEIPMVVLEKWCNEDGINYLRPEHKKALMRKIHERDNSLFKVHPGRFV